MLDQLAKNITRCGLSNSTLNYLRVGKIGLLSLNEFAAINLLLMLHFVSLCIVPIALCDIGAHAGADVQT